MEKLKTSDFLIRAKSHIEKGWTQRELARTAHGDATDPESVYACSWCAVGALRKVLFDHVGTPNVYFRAQEYMAAMTVKNNAITIVDWNDNKYQTKAGVLEGFDTAIKMAKDAERLKP